MYDEHHESTEYQQWLADNPNPNPKQKEKDMVPTNNKVQRHPHMMKFTSSWKCMAAESNFAGWHKCTITSSQVNPDGIELTLTVYGKFKAKISMRRAFHPFWLKPGCGEEGRARYLRDRRLMTKLARILGEKDPGKWRGQVRVKIAYLEEKDFYSIDEAVFADFAPTLEQEQERQAAERKTLNPLRLS